MAMMEFPSSIVEQACEERLEFNKTQQRRVSDILSMSFHNLYLVGDLQHKLKEDRFKICQILQLCQCGLTIFIDDYEYNLLKDYL